MWSHPSYSYSSFPLSVDKIGARSGVKLSFRSGVTRGKRATEERSQFLQVLVTEWHFLFWQMVVPSSYSMAHPESLAGACVRDVCVREESVEGPLLSSGLCERLPQSVPWLRDTSCIS